MTSTSLYFLIILMFFVSLIVQSSVSSKFKKYSQAPVSSGMTGYQAAEAILKSAGLDDVKIEMTHGTLSDHYDPMHKTLRLSEGVLKAHPSPRWLSPPMKRDTPSSTPRVISRS